MIPKVHKAASMRRLMRYLAGKGKADEHTNQRVLAGDLVTRSVYLGRLDVDRAVEIARLLDSPRQLLRRGEPVLAVSHRKAKALMAEGVPRAEAFAAATSEENTWHCSLSLAAGEGQLDDEKWAAIAYDFMAEMGFTQREDEVPDARWAAVHHGLSRKGNDHIHLAVGAVRPDGSLIDTYRDQVRAQAACRALEHKYGLRVLAGREDGGTERGTSQAERARKERTGAPETESEALRRRVRATAMTASSEADWLRQLRAAGVVVRPRFAQGGTEEVTGYAVRLPAAAGSGEKSIWYSGGRLAKDLTLSALRDWAPWESGPRADADALAEWKRGLGTGGEPRRGAEARDPAAQAQVIEQLGQWSRYMRTIPVEDRAAWAQAASQSAGAVAALSVRTEVRPGPLDQLSRQLARAGQQPAHQRGTPGTHGTRLRAVSLMLWSMQSEQAGSVALATALVECLLEFRRMLDASDRAHAAAAMASQARRVLTEVHMRADGIDPAIAYRREAGSPAWAAAVRAAVVVDGLDRDHHEREIAKARDAWDKHRRHQRAFGFEGEEYDEKGRILSTPTPPSAAAAPLTPPAGHQRTSRVDPSRFGWTRQMRPGAWAAQRDASEDINLHPVDEPPTSEGKPRSEPRDTGQDRAPYRAPDPGRDRDHGHGR
ncbi:relaxase/mobilization nuclease domain-containing protein [Nocardia sp. NPDC003693]